MEVDGITPSLEKCSHIGRKQIVPAPSFPDFPRLSPSFPCPRVSHLPMTNIFPASGQDDFLWIDVFSQNQFRRICLID